MKHSMKRRLATFCIRYMKIPNLLRRLQPIATEITFGRDIRPRIDEIRGLLTSFTLPLTTYKRFGDDFDGGYLLSAKIESRTNCISIGVGTNISFDIAISRFVDQVHLYDHTVTELPQIAPVNVKFFSNGLGPKSVGQYLTLQDCVAKFPDTSDLILKVDIEGAEWDIFDNETQIDFTRFAQIAVEFHDFYRIYNDSHFHKVIRVLNKLNVTHQVINIHANNWGKFEIVANVPFADVLEVTYISKLALHESLPAPSLNDLNKPCNPNAHEIVLTF